VVVTVIADQAAVDAAREMVEPPEPADPIPPAEPGPLEAPVPAASHIPAELATVAESRPARQDVGTAILAGTVLPTPMLAELLRNGAKLQPLCTPEGEPEPRYRPSAKLARFVRSRDLTCRFPGCTVPAERCDIDHVIPYPIGGTHAGNLVCECRKHHLLKTFWVGDWALVLLPDGRRPAGVPTPPIRAVECSFPTGTPPSPHRRPHRHRRHP